MSPTVVHAAPRAFCMSAYRKRADGSSSVRARPPPAPEERYDDTTKCESMRHSAKLDSIALYASSCGPLRRCHIAPQS